MAKNGKSETVSKPRSVVNVLSDIGPREVTVEIERDDEILVFKGHTLSYHQYQEIGWQVDDPEPPVSGFDKVNNRPIYNRNDPGFRHALDRANADRMYRRLLAFLSLDVPGDTIEAQVDALKNALEVDVLNSLTRAMGELMSGSEARIVGRAETFQSESL